MAVRIIQRFGHSVRAWFSNEFAGQSLNGPLAQEGEVGYLFDTDQDGVYREGVWVFYPSQRQLLMEIRELLDRPPAEPPVYDDQNPLVTRLAATIAAPAAPTYRVEIGVVAPVGFAAELIPGTGRKITVKAFYTSKPSAVVTIRLIKNRTPSSGGTSSNSTIVPMDSTYPSDSTCKLFTGAPTAGVAVGDVFERVMETTDDVYEEFGINGAAPLVLYGPGETLAVNASAIATLVGYIEFTEGPL